MIPFSEQKHQHYILYYNPSKLCNWITCHFPHIIAPQWKKNSLNEELHTSPQMQITCEIGGKKPKHYILTCKKYFKSF